MKTTRFTGGHLKSSLLACRLIWLRFSSIPFHLLGKQCFATTTRSFGNFVSLDEETENLHRLDYVRIVVKTNAYKKIDVCNNTRINGKVYQMRVVEETCLQPSRCSCWLCKAGTASREGSTIESNARCNFYHRS